MATVSMEYYLKSLLPTVKQLVDSFDDQQTTLVTNHH